MSYAIAGKIAGLGSVSSGYYGQGRGPRPGSPYLYSGIRGLGDASYDAALAAYNADHAAWVEEQAAFTQAVQAYAAQTAGQASAFAAATAGYNAALASWQTQQAAYTQALALAEGAGRGIVMGYASATTAAQKAYPGIVLPPSGYDGCVTQAQSNAWADACRSASIKGLGAVPTGPVCGLALLPVCQTMPALPASPGPAPSPPVRPAPPPVPTPLRPEPLPPAPPAAVPASTSSTVPASAPYPTVTDSLDPVISTPDATPAASTKSAGLLTNGLLLVVLAGGSYALYRSLRKPRARVA